LWWSASISLLTTSTAQDRGGKDVGGAEGPSLPGALL
jgi:hypothetical protein